MKLFLIFVALVFAGSASCQTLDPGKYSFTVTTSKDNDHYFRMDKIWRGADGAASIDLENGRVLWLFSDGFICGDTTMERKNSKMINNSIAIQNGHGLCPDSLKYYWDQSGQKPGSFFKVPGKSWFWTGHGGMIRDRLLVFLMDVRKVKSGLGFEVFGWHAVLVKNPHDDPSKWQKKYIKGARTFGTIAGSAAVLKDEKFLYAYGAVEPGSHEVYLLRWKIEDAWQGNLQQPEWWINDGWKVRKSEMPVPEPLFIGGTEYSVHYDKVLKKYIQIQSFGFGEGSLGLRMADSIQGKWTELKLIYKPDYSGIKKPFMYAARAHPELRSDGILVTYNVNSFDFGELIANHEIYFPRFILLKIKKKE